MNKNVKTNSRRRVWKTVFRKDAGLLLFAAALIVPSAMAASKIVISPSYTTVGVNGTVPYSATVTGLTSTTVTWKVNSVTGGNSTYGTITTGGLYTAPATIPSAGITVTALGSDNKTSATVYVAVEPAGPSISAISPNPIPVGSYSVTITGSGFVSGAVARVPGINLSTTFVNATTLTASGYQGSAASIAFQVMNPSTLWGAPFTVAFVKSGPPPPQIISPTSATVTLGMTQQFTSAGATAWSATAGTISSTGLYMAPATMPSSSKVTVTATGPGGSASATVTLQSLNPQTISPTSVSLNLGATQQFTSSGATSWGATAGTISSTGFYTAPSQLPASGTDTVSVTGPNGTATATVTLIPPTPVITGVGGTLGNPGQIPLGLFSTTITGTGFAATSVTSLNGTALATVFSNGSLTVTGYASASGAGSVTVTNGSAASQPFPVTVGIANALVSAAAARHFLQQAAFGPTAAEANNVQTLGFQGWLSQQIAAPKVSSYGGLGSQGSFSPTFLANAVGNPDQLRQRVAFALSQILVTSIEKNIWTSTTAPFEEMLMTDAFSNFRQILNDVTLAPAMGQFLDMANNAKANAAGSTLPNENYAREVMQLFTIGTAMLNIDGTKQLDGSGNAIPTYDQTTVANFAKVFTGWTYAPTSGGVSWGAYINETAPMVPYDLMHDTTAKTLLQYSVPSGVLTSLPAGQNAQTDLTEALDNIFNHPNVGPFISRQLIQHLVESNPTPAYVQRVATVFNNNGSGVRGDMQAVILAILLDPEARQNDVPGMTQARDGHLQEPILFMAAFLRAVGATINSQNYSAWDLGNLSQDIYNAPSVFNYFSPGYQVPTLGLGGPEFQIYTPYSSVYRDNLVSDLFGAYSSNVMNYGPGNNIDITPFVSIAGNPQMLVDALDLTFTNGLAPAGLKTILLNAITAETGGNLRRAQTGIYLLLASSYYNVWN